MTQLIMEFKPEQFWPVPEGTILKYLKASQDPSDGKWTVRCEIIGWPYKGTAKHD